MVRYCFAGHNLIDALGKGMIERETFRCLSKPEDLFVLWRREDIFALAEDLPVTRLRFVGTDMFTPYFREMVDGFSEEEFALWLEYHRVIREREDLVGLSFHTLDVLRKEDAL